jgi:hypothetical protein
MNRRNFPDAYEWCALDFSIMRAALRSHLEAIRGIPQFAEAQLATEVMIERIDNADNVWMEINI